MMIWVGCAAEYVAGVIIGVEGEAMTNVTSTKCHNGSSYFVDEWVSYNVLSVCWFVVHRVHVRLHMRVGVLGCLLCHS